MPLHLSDLHKLHVAVALPCKDDHVCVGVVKRHQDARGHVQAQHVLGGPQHPQIPQTELPATIVEFGILTLKTYLQRSALNPEVRRRFSPTQTTLLSFMPS